MSCRIKDERGTVTLAMKTLNPVLPVWSRKPGDSCEHVCQGSWGRGSWLMV